MVRTLLLPCPPGRPSLRSAAVLDCAANMALPRTTSRQTKLKDLMASPPTKWQTVRERGPARLRNTVGNLVAERPNCTPGAHSIAGFLTPSTSKKTETDGCSSPVCRRVCPCPDRNQGRYSIVKRVGLGICLALALVATANLFAGRAQESGSQRQPPSNGASPVNPLRLELLRWYGANTTT